MRTIANWRTRTFGCCLIAATALTLLLPSSSFSNVLFEAALNGGYTDNLLSDSTGLIDKYSVASGMVRWYPVSTLELSVNGDWTLYDRVAAMSNRLGRIGLTYIPLKATSRLSIYANAAFDGRRYHSELSYYDLNTLDSRITTGYRFGEVATLRWGVGFRTYSYLATESGDREMAETFVGLNTTPFGRNSLDIEAGFGRMDYEHVKSNLIFVNPQYPERSLTGSKLKSFYVSPRWSRPLDEKNGISVTFSYRTFMNTDEGIVFGSSVGLLSPWTAVWEGTSIAATLKSYLIPQAITTLGCGYWNRHHLPTIESDNFPIVMGRERDDDQVRAFVQVIRPFTTSGGQLIQPRLTLEYTNNNSSNELFEYSAMVISTGISFRY